MQEPEQRARTRDWVWALLRVRALWPLPALLLLAVLLPLAPEEAWHPQLTTRRTLSRAELALVLSGVGAALTWLLLLLSRRGLLFTGRSWGMREPSEAEERLAEAGLRMLCLFMTYAGPALLLWGH